MSNTSVLQTCDLEVIKDTAAGRTSKKHYTCIETKPIVEKLEAMGLTMHETSIANTRKPENEGHQKHMIIFNTGHMIDADNEIQLLLTNAHNGRAALKFNIGIFRTVCANGLVVGEELFSERILHRNPDMDEVDRIIKEFKKRIPAVAASAKKMLETPIDFSSKIARDYIERCVRNTYDDKNRGIKRNYIFDHIHPKRKEDKIQNVYNLLNFTQEHIMTGNVNYEKDTKDDQGDYETRKVNKLSDIKRINDGNQFIYEEARLLLAA